MIILNYLAIASFSGATDGAGMTIGVDFGDRYSQLCVLDERGEVCEEGRIATDGLDKHWDG